ncbi:unnamed protein product [Protopolystoma xenopodis]|uniref:Uncharacterized protein n=1 Tax=Protopolystoma xenopodis TaxID=117903 RepID=A0A3S5BMP4_9PLAT|nr:unnamed protein product [Protopolystoma xenopodis]
MLVECGAVGVDSEVRDAACRLFQDHLTALTTSSDLHLLKPDIRTAIYTIACFSNGQATVDQLIKVGS